MDDAGRTDDFVSRYKLPLAMAVVGGVLLIGGILSSGIIPKTFIKSTKSGAENPTVYSGIVKVDVSGGVANPGVYSLPTGSRIEDAIKTAGGLTENADMVYVSKGLNLAQKVSDGTKVYVPVNGEKTAGNDGSVMSAQAELVNINTATAVALDKLPGVGAVTAQNIIEKRPFGSIEELLTKKAVSRSVYEKIKTLVSVY